MDKGNMQRAEPEGNPPAELQTGRELADFIKRTGTGITLTDNEAELLLGYFEGHGYVLGERGGVLYRGDLVDTRGMTVWEAEEYPPDDVIDTACEWNYEMASHEEEALKKLPDLNADEAGHREALARLKEDGKVLDRLFEQTKYGKRMEETAQRIADMLTAAVERSDNIDRVVRAAGEEIRRYGQGGRSR